MITTPSATVAKPTALPVLADNIPLEMKARAQWVVWKYTWKPKQQKWDKPPYNARTGRLASSTNAETWSSWEVAWAAYEGGGWDGVGYVFSGEPDDFFGCDLDKCRDPQSGLIKVWTRVQRQRWHPETAEPAEIIQQLNTYGEISPSQTGCKLVGRGLPSRTGKRGDFELYNIGRYFTITGQRHPECSETTNAVGEERLAKLSGWFWPERVKEKSESVTSSESTASAVTPTADAIISKLRSSKSGGKFSRLFDSGDASGYPSASEADAALCFLAAFYSGRNAKLIDEVYRKSALLRDKWDEKHFADGTTYGEATVANVLAKCSNFYDWEAKRKKARQEEVAKSDSEVAATSQPRGLPVVVLPGDSVTITQSADLLGGLLGETREFYLRGGVPMRARQEDGEVKLEVLRPAAACSDFERVAKLNRIKTTEQGQIIVPTICSEPRAKQIIEASSFRARLPRITVLSRCPVMIERNGGLTVINGYDLETGIWAAGPMPRKMPLSEAKQKLYELLADFEFASAGDHSRALAALITPALVFGGLLNDRAPIDLGEADNSQTGKGYRNKLTTAVYGLSPRVVTQRERGVGSLHESFDQALISGSSFIALDNLRGKLEIAAIESFMTESSYFARIPYSPPIEIDPTRIMLLLTTNKAELTRDMANRSSVVRICKHPDNFQFRRFPEGDLLRHAQTHQPDFLGAIFSVIDMWHQRGKPELALPGHDFRRWGCVLGWIVENLLEAAPLTEGHRELQSRISSTESGWLRDLVLALKEDGKLGHWLRANQILDVLVERQVPTPNIDLTVDLQDDASFKRVVIALGRKLSKIFPDEATKEVKVENWTFNRRKSTDNEGREKNEYAIFPQFPNDPQCAPNQSPNQNKASPNPPNQKWTSCSEVVGSEREGDEESNKTYAPIGGIGGNGCPLGETPAAACDHLDPAAWVRKGNQAHCPGCDRFMGMVGGIAKEAVQ